MIAVRDRSGKDHGILPQDVKYVGQTNTGSYIRLTGGTIIFVDLPVFKVVDQINEDLGHVVR